MWVASLSVAQNDLSQYSSSKDIFHHPLSGTLKPPSVPFTFASLSDMFDGTPVECALLGLEDDETAWAGRLLTPWGKRRFSKQTTWAECSSSEKIEIV